MFVYLSKKIAIPNNTKLQCIAWNKSEGYLACGGEDGLLKVLRLDSGNNMSNSKAASAPSNLSMNQTLEGHGGSVQVVTWNEGPSQKLTSSDQYGLITVWMLYKGSWYEEMINNRNKSVVTDMVWSADGQKICIIYEDGAVIVGSVDGNRIWGRELKGMNLTNVEWSPDGRWILYGVQGGDVHIFDSSGNSVSQVIIKCVRPMSESMTIIGIQWYSGKGGYVEPNCPCLAICYSSGCMQIMRNEHDDDPVIVDGGIRAASIQWNHNGSLLALAGTAKMNENEVTKECNVVQFYTPFGEHLRTLKVPGKEIVGCSWEGGGLRIALAIDSFIYFANIRPNYKWCYFSNTIVYTFTKSERADTCVVFWNIKNNERYVKYVKHLLAIVAGNEYCVLSTKSEDDGDQFALVICNAIGTPVDSKYVDLCPKFLSMSANHILSASHDKIMIWTYRTSQIKSALNISSSIQDTTTDRIYSIDEMNLKNVNGIPKYKEPILDRICCICHTEKVAVVARESGLIQQFTVPELQQTETYNLSCQPFQIAINCTSTRLSVIDNVGSVLFLELKSDKTLATTDKTPVIHRLDRKDVWDLKWSTENSDLCVLMEKTRMYVFRNLNPEEPIVCNGYICHFEDLQIKTVLLDEILKNPENPNCETVVDMEVKSLRDTRELLNKVAMSDVMQFVEDNPHPRLWQLLAEAALEKMDLKTAEAAFVRYKNYSSIEFVKRLNNIQNEKLKRAEVASYFHKFDEAEKLFLESDRRDLAISLRRKLGDWFRVVQLLNSGSTGGDDTVYNEAWNAIGDYFADRQKWEEAATHYEKGNNQEKLAQCYFGLEDYSNLEKLVNNLPDGHKLLSGIAGMFATMGMCDQAVLAYIKDDKIKNAIDCCITLNNWGKAVELAERYHVKDISPLLSKYAQHLLEKDKVLNAVELYRKAGRFLEAIQLLCKIAGEERKRNAHPLHMKKLYVLVILAMEDYRNQQSRNPDKQKASNVIANILTEDSVMYSQSDSKLLDTAWQGAEVYHFYLLAQRQLYEGYFDAAMKTALHLQSYESLIDPEEIYLLIALTSCANRAFGICSKAFIKLESLENIPTDRQQAYEALATDIFVKYPPKDTRTYQVECPTCGGKMSDWCNVCPTCNSKYPVCTASGRCIFNPALQWVCHRCKRSATIQDMTSRKTCPLCHASV